MNDTKEVSYYYEEPGATNRNFEENYRGFLTNVEEGKAAYKYLEGSYIDPDVCESVKKTEFYNHLTCFLNHQEKKHKKSDYLFLPPSEAPLTTTKEKNSKMDEKKITVIQGGDVLFRLTSDQFGFSANETIYSSDKHPLAKLFRCALKEQKEIEGTKKLIARYVKNTRTIGGSFLWSLSPKGRRICSYNTSRGKFLEDRVDLTLLEIKHALDGSYDNGMHTSDILYNQYKNNEYIKKWLKHFDSFEMYVEYFMLGSFVEDNVPINIIDDEPLNDDYIKMYKEQDKRHSLQKLTADEIRAMLERLESKILERSEKMEKVIKPYYEENHG